jgi:RNA polymerase sigma-70 factor (ECF subfamily)
LDREIEIDLARRLIAGDAGAFDRFVEHFQTKIFRHAWLMCRNREDAEEVAQEALLRVFEKFDQLKTPERVRPWVFQIARNECLMKRRRSIFAPERELSLEELMPVREMRDGGFRIEIADWSILPENEVLQSEMRGVLADAIAALPDNYRPVILLRDMEEMSTEETAQILGLSEDVVRTRLHRARLALRKDLDRYFRAHPAGKSATKEEGKE